MLKFLTKSKIRRKIILLYLYNQNKEFYLSEIAGKVGTSSGTAQRELNRLLEEDLLLFKKKAGRSIYALNLRYTLLDELKSIVRKTMSAEVELRAGLAKVKGIVYAFLFGSYVKGGLKSESDIDLFILGNVDEDEIFKTIQKIEKEIGREISYHLAHVDEFRKKIENSYFHRDILKNFILLIGEKNGFKQFIK